MRCRAGFTLTETVVVVAMLMILAGMTFPVFAQVREKARQTSCAANLAQIGKAMYMYSQDWDGLTPPYAVKNLSPDLPLQNRLMLISLTPYARNAAIWRCPSDPISGQDRIGAYTVHRWSSYVFAGPDAGEQPLRADDPVPAGDRGPAQVTYAVDDTVYLTIAVTSTGRRVMSAPHPGNHRDGANRLFFDGHVRHWSYPDLTRASSSLSRRP
jgi:prepilin-type processing-associated H-X9-DG protein